MPLVLPSGYLDATAGEPLHPKAREILLAASDQAWADPDGLTPPSRQARTLIDAAAEQIAGLLGTHRDRICFVPDGLGAQLDGLAGRLAYSAVERAPVLERALAQPSMKIGVDHNGRIDVDEVRACLKADDHLFIQAANGEVGTRQPLPAILAIAQNIGAHVHSDYHHAIGRVPILADLTSASVNATSWAGPRGIGIVISDRKHRFPNISTPLALASAAALEGWLEDETRESQRLSDLIDHLRSALVQIPDVDLVGDPDERLPHILTASFLYVDGQRLMDELARHGIYVGSGSACTSSRVEPSHVLAAMGALTHGNLRIVLPHGVASSDVERLGALLPPIVEQVRNDLR